MPRKTKVIYVITKSEPFGGAQRYVYDLATHLPRDKFEILVAHGGKGLLANKLDEAGISTIPIASLERDISLGKEIKSFFELIKLFKKTRPDIVHLNSSKAGGLGALAARLASIPKIVFTAHGWPFWENRSKLARVLIWFFSWLTLLLSHKTICISQYDLSVARRMPFAGKKAEHIYNGVHPIDFLPRKTEADKVNVLTNAELNRNKNLFTGIDAVAKARESGAQIKYSIMSDGELRGALEKYIEDKKYKDFVSLLGFVPEGKRYYKNFDIFFLPSKKEGLPYVLLEAGLAGLPVVASDVGGIPEIIDNGASGILLPPADVIGFAKALAKLAQDQALRNQFGENLKKKVEKDFSLQKMIDETAKLYS